MTKDITLEINNSAVVPITKLTRWQRSQPHLRAFAFYTVLTLIVAWPVVGHLGVGTPGQFPTDRNQNLWNMWWFKRSVFNFQNPYETSFLFFPHGTNLYLHTLSLYNQLVGFPLQLIFGIVPTYGFLELLTFPLGGYAGWLLGRYLVGDSWGALLVGLVWSFGPYHWVELRQDQINLLSLQWLPIFILFMFKLEKSTTRQAVIRNTLLAAFFYFLTLLVDYYYAIYLLMFAALYWAWRVGATVWQHRAELAETVRPLAAFTLKLAVAFGLGMLPYSPILYKTITETSNPVYQSLTNATSHDQVHSTDLATLFLPPAHQPWWGDNLWQTWLKPTIGNSVLNDWGAVLGYVAVVLSVYALWKVRRAGLGFWFFSGLFWLLISFGPSLRINGPKPGWPMPYRLLEKVPFIGIGRFPERYMLMAQLSLGILGAFGLAYLLNSLPQTARLFGRLSWRTAVGSLVLILFYLESFPGFLAPPLPISQPSFTVALGKPDQPLAGSAILEIPVTKHSNPDSPRMLSQIYHERPIDGGYVSRDLIDFDRTSPYPDWYNWVELLTPTTPDILPALSQPDRLGLLSFAKFGFIVVYPHEFLGDQTRLQRLQALLNLTFGTTPGQPAKPFYQDDQAQLYEVPPTTLTHLVMLLDEGWGATEPVDNRADVLRWLNADASEGRVKIVAPAELLSSHSYTLQAEMVSPPDKPRHLIVVLNGQTVGNFTLNPGANQITLPNLPLQPGDNVLDLKPDPADGYYTSAKDPRHLRLGAISLALR